MHLITFGIVVCLLVLAEFYIRLHITPIENGKPKHSQDFITFYTASDLTLEGRPDLVFDPDAFLARERDIVPSTKSIPWFYPPTYLLMTYPLALTDYVTARLVFFLGGLLLFVHAAHLWLRWPGGLFAVAAFAPVFSNLTFGQNGLFTASFMLLALHYLGKRPWLSGLFIGLLTIKPHLGILIPLALLVSRDYRTFLWSTVFSLLVILSSAVAFGVSPWQHFTAMLTAAGSHLSEGKLLLSGMISVTSNALLVDLPDRTALILHGVALLPFLVVFVRTWRHSENPFLKGASLSLATLMCSPYLFDYDLTWLGIAIGLLAVNASKNGWLRGESAILAMAWLLPLADLLMTLGGSKDWFPYNLWLPMNLALLWVIHKRLQHELSPPRINARA